MRSDLSRIFRAVTNGIVWLVLIAVPLQAVRAQAPAQSTPPATATGAVEMRKPVDRRR